MGEKVDLYIHLAIQKLNEKIDRFIETYQPANLTIEGTSNFNGNTTIGTDDSDLLTINAETTFNSDVNADVVNINTLTVYDDAVIGQDDDDHVTVNSLATFASDVTFNSGFDVTSNATFGTTTTNTVTSAGSVTAPHFIIPKVTGNSLKLGIVNTIIYTEYSTDINIFSTYSTSVIVTVKNTHTAPISITYDDENSNHSLPANETNTYLKTSTSEFTLIHTPD